MRAHAHRLGLAVAAKPDSQDICFVPNGHYSDVVARLRPDAFTAGEIVHVDGRSLGRHDGTARFTVGQRRGLHVADGERLYVVAIEPERSRVVVGPRHAADCTQLHLTGLNWLTGDAPVQPLAIKHRYNEPATAGRIELQPDGHALVTLDEPQSGVAPGQACVAYAGTRLLGGGWIDRATAAWQSTAARRIA